MEQYSWYQPGTTVRRQLIILGVIQFCTAPRRGVYHCLRGAADCRMIRSAWASASDKCSRRPQNFVNVDRRRRKVFFCSTSATRTTYIFPFVNVISAVCHILTLPVYNSDKRFLRQLRCLIKKNQTIFQCRYEYILMSSTISSGGTDSRHVAPPESLWTRFRISGLPDRRYKDPNNCDVSLRCTIKAYLLY